MTGLATAGEPNDPRLWLEDVTGDRALAWVRERNAESTAELTKSEAFRSLEARLLAILDSNAKIPFVSKIGPYYYNFWKDAQHKRGLWRRTTLDEYRKAEPSWETVIDLDALGALEKENWVWHGASPLKPDYERCLISLSRGGADADIKREFDLKTKAFVEGRLHPARGQEPGRLARDRQRVRRHQLRAGLAHQVGLSQDRQGVGSRTPRSTAPRSSSKGRRTT